MPIEFFGIVVLENDALVPVKVMAECEMDAVEKIYANADIFTNRPIKRVSVVDISKGSYIIK
jgi:hypothetical protein